MPKTDQQCFSQKYYEDTGLQKSQFVNRSHTYLVLVGQLTFQYVPIRYTNKAFGGK